MFNLYLGKAAIDDLVYAITPDPTSRLAKLKTGECSFIFGPRPQDLDEIKKDPNLTLTSQPGLNIAYWAFNTKKPPFDKKEVRQAFNMAIDKAAIIKDVYNGAGQAAKNLIPPTIWSYNDNVKDYPYDPEKAKAMLKAAGVATPLEIDLWYMPVQRPYNPNAKRIAEMMQSDLAKIGVNAKLVTYEWGEYRKRAAEWRAHDGPARLDRRQWRPRQFLLPARLLGRAIGGQNITKWCNKDFDDMLNKARQTTDVKARTKLYEQMQVIEKEEAPDFTIAHSVVFEAMRKNVVGYKVSPLGAHQFYGVDLK